MMLAKNWIAGCVALGRVALAGSAGAQQSLSIATGGTGGVYYPLGGGFGNIMGKECPGMTVTAQVTGGSVANLQLIGSGKADLCFSQVDAAYDASRGATSSRPSYRSAPWPSCTPTTCTS